MLPHSVSDVLFDQQNKQLKQSLEDYNHFSENIKLSVFMDKEFAETMSYCYEQKPFHIQPLKNLIKWGYPLPLSSIPVVIEVISNWLTQINLYDGGITLEVYGEDVNRILISQKFGRGETSIFLRPMNGTLFVCEADYLAYADISGAVSDSKYKYIKGFIYECLINVNENFFQIFPKYGESVREILLEHL